MLFGRLLLRIVFFDFKNAVKRFTFNQCYLGISWTNMHSSTHIAYVKYNNNCRIAKRLKIAPNKFKIAIENIYHF